jgi:hypothetical protein
MARDSFIFYRSYYEAMNGLKDKDKLQLFNAISELSLNENETKLTGVCKNIFTAIKPQIVANSERYENGKRGGRPKKETNGFQKEKTSGFEIEKPNKNENENVNENDNDNDNNIASEDKSSSATAKASKHKYGKYKHVLLKDEELQSLKKEYSNWEELINYLDEYIEMKGYKAKSHYLCVKKWVVDAVKRQGGKSKKASNFEQREYEDLSYLYANE